MSKNPFLKADQKVIAMYKNTVTFHFVTVIRTYDSATGEMTNSKTDSTAVINVSDPSVISESVASVKNYVVGDLLFDIARLDIEKNLPAGRTADLSSCGVKFDSDYIVFGSQKYRIVSMNPETVWNNIPSKYKMQLRLHQESV